MPRFAAGEIAKYHILMASVPMASILAYADATDSSQINFLILLCGIGLIVVAGILMFIIIFLARSRRHRQGDYLVAAAIFWAILAAASFIYPVVSRLKWSQETTLRLETGYGNPQEQSDAPQLPWLPWLGLGVIYAMLLTWSLSQNNSQTFPSPSADEQGGN